MDRQFNDIFWQQRLLTSKKISSLYNLQLFKVSNDIHGCQIYKLRLFSNAVHVLNICPVINRCHGLYFIGLTSFCDFNDVGNIAGDCDRFHYVTTFCGCQESLMSTSPDEFHLGYTVCHLRLNFYSLTKSYGMEGLLRL